jgi:hypothetical protein
MKRLVRFALGIGALCTVFQAMAVAQQPAAPAAPRPPDYPPYSEVTNGYEKVGASIDGVTKPSMYTIWRRNKDNQLLAELPPDYQAKKYFFAMTVATGEQYAGLQAGDMYVYWRAYDKRLALMEPNIGTRSTGDAPSQKSVKNLFTDRVILDIPIVTMSPMGGPVIDLDALLVGQSSRFFPGMSITNPALATIKTAKAFPQNVEIGFEAPMSGGGGIFGGGGGSGRLKTIHYSISVIPEPSGSFQPRVADQRIGYFTTSYVDLGKFKDDDKRIRYINRWKLKKADASLKLSPPEEPIRFYIEQTTPDRYRHWVKKGILYWNKAFENVGIRDAIVVLQQDPRIPGGEGHTDKDPEDVRYNFVRWLSNDQGTAIGPSRVHPLTGEILDADIILTDGWIRHYVKQYLEVLPSVAMEGFTPETLSWLESHPSWDPRMIFAPPSDRSRLIAERAARGPSAFGGHPLASASRVLMGTNEYDGLVGRTSQVNGLCLAAEGKALDLELLRMTLELMSEELQEPKKDEPKKDEPKKDEPKKDEKKEEPKKEEPKKEEKPKTDLLDGLPEEFIGPLIAELVAHEVGHTLGLRHNFRASGMHSLADINSAKVKGKPLAGSVMDYLPININMKDGDIQGDFCLMELGPYDMWAIEYGYTSDQNALKGILDRVASPELQYATDEDTSGPDPLARRYDFSANPLDYAKSQMRLAKHHRERIVEKFVKDGESWGKARRGYEMTLLLQTRSLGMMAGWVGGAHVHRDKKGDKNGRPPLEVVPAKTQREAMQFCIENSFHAEAFGLTPDLLKFMTADAWLDSEHGFGSRMEGADWPVHDRIMGIQSSTLTMLMNPTTLRRVYDNEFRTPADQDMLTLPELFDAVSNAIWSELDKAPAEPGTARKPWLSSLRRNLQREHLERLIELSLPDAGFTAAYKPISNLSVMKLRQLKEKLAKCMDQKANMDPYSLAHLSEAQVRIDKALDAQFIYNAGAMGGRGGGGIIFLKEPQTQAPAPLVPQEP